MISKERNVKGCFDCFLFLILFFAWGLSLPTTLHAAPAKTAAAKDKAAGKDKAAEVQDSNQVIAKDYVCEADVYYVWKPFKKSKEQKNPGFNNSGSKETTTPATTEGTSPVHETFFVRVGEKGAVKIDVEERLATKLANIKEQAIKACEEEHRNLALCLQKKLNALSTNYRFLDFETRRLLTDATREDCLRNLGTCVGARTDKILCFDFHPPGTSSAGEEQSSDTAEGEKGKKGEELKKPAEKKVK